MKASGSHDVFSRSMLTPMGAVIDSFVNLCRPEQRTTLKGQANAENGHCNYHFGISTDLETSQDNFHKHHRELQVPGNSHSHEAIVLSSAGESERIIQRLASIQRHSFQ